ncbi:MAG: sulfatase [Acidobacteriota bacterium]
MTSRIRLFLVLVLVLLGWPPWLAADDRPDILLITVDTLRADRLSGYGYERPTSPRLDALFAEGALFTDARTVEPLTNPALSSMITASFPHEHGATRNGLRMRPDLESLPKVLDRAGYRTAAFVANWTLKDSISGLAEHFDHYGEILTRKRWFGFFKGEATAEDVNAAAIEWLGQESGRRRPVFSWVHYVEPHAPYLLHKGYLDLAGEASKSDRYDTEVAYVDDHIGQLLDALPPSPRSRLVIFTSDHGESLGEHGYWGHGRNLHEPGLHIPLAFHWPGKLGAGRVTEPALLIDVAPTILGLLGLSSPDSFRGFDWSARLQGRSDEVPNRACLFQAHKGAVLGSQEADNARRAGLLAVGLLRDGKKEILRLGSGQLRLFELAQDPSERRNLSSPNGQPSAELLQWRELVEDGLERTEGMPPPDVDPESVEKLKSLGYTN